MMKAVGTKKMFVVLTILLITSLFTSGQAFAWTVTSNFDSGTIGANASGASGFSYAGDQTTIDNTHSHSGTQSAKFHWVGNNYGAGADGWTHEHGEFTGLTGTGSGIGVWARGYFYWPAGFNFTAWQYSKLIRIGDINGHKITIDINNAGSPSDPGKLVISNETANTMSDIPNTNLSTGVWHCIELYDYQSSSSPITRVWMDGVLVYENKTDSTYEGIATNDVLFMSQWNGWDSHSTINQDQWIDDIVVTNQTPTGRDVAGNPMIGPTSGSTGSALQPPTGLLVVAK